MRREQPRLGAANVVTVIPTVGRNTLPVAVQSALSQNVNGHRVVVITDGLRVLPSLPDDKHLSVIILPQRTGSPGAMRNVAMSLIESNFFAFLDDDNSWAADHLSISLAKLATTGADISYAACQRFDEHGELVDILGRPWNHHSLRAESWIDTSAIVLRSGHRYVWSRVPLRYRVEFAEDWAFVYRYGFRRKVVFTEAVTVNYAMRESHAALVRRQRLGEAPELLPNADE